MARILVVYGTTDGQTAKIAQRIVETLWAHDIDADIADARVTRPNPAAYAGVIVAASVHAGGYQRAVGRWLRENATALRKRPAVFVSVCLGVLQHDPKVDRELDAIRAKFLDSVGWQAAEVKVVAGALPYTRYNWAKRWLLRRIVAKAGGDTDTSRDYEYTDWNDVEAFALEFGRRVLQTEAGQKHVARTVSAA